MMSMCRAPGTYVFLFPRFYLSYKYVGYISYFHAFAKSGAHHGGCYPAFFPALSSVSVKMTQYRQILTIDISITL